MQQLIDRLNRLANVANLKGLRTTQPELAAWQNTLETRADPMGGAAQRYFEGFLNDFTAMLDSQTNNANDETLARHIRNAKNALAINEQLVDAVMTHIRDNLDTAEKATARERFLEEQGGIQDNIENHRMTFSLAQLLTSNEKHIAALKNVWGLTDADLPAPYVAERPAQDATFSHDDDDEYSATTKRGLFSMFSKLLKNLGNPNKDIQSTMTSFLGSFVEAIVGALAGLFKRALGADSNEMVNEFASNAKKAFTRFTTEAQRQEQAIPDFLPTFQMYRQQQAEQQARAQAAAQAAPSSSSSSSQPRSTLRT